MGRHRLVAKPEVSPVQPPPSFNMKFLTPICLIALILAFGMALGQGNGGYDLLTCGESKGTNPDSDPEVDKHCVHTKVHSIPIDPKGDEKDRDLRFTLFYFGRCAPVVSHAVAPVAVSHAVHAVAPVVSSYAQVSPSAS